MVVVLGLTYLLCSYRTCAYEVAALAVRRFFEYLVTDGMNDLQHIDEKLHGPVLVTLNPPFEPATNFGEYNYEHPVLDGKVCVCFPVYSSKLIPTQSQTQTLIIPSSSSPS